MVGSAMMVVSGWSLMPGELLLRKWIELELEVRFMMTTGHLEKKKRENGLFHYIMSSDAKMKD